jgi:hypothetical protein
LSDQPQPPAARHGMQIQSVDPIGFADEASAILKTAWQPPCVDYTPEYLRFHCSFPTSLAPVALTAFDGDEAVGYIAATGRSSNIGELYLGSFLGARPGTPSMLSVALQRQHLRTITKQLSKPLLAFTYFESVGDYLVRSCNFAGVKRIPLGEYRMHATVPRGQSSGIGIRQVSPADWAEAAKTFSDDELLLSPQFDAATVQHMAKDPAGRQFLTAVDGDTLVGVCVRAVTPTLTANGVENFPVLHYIRLLDGHADALKALLWHAKDPAIPLVTVTNMIRVPPATAKAAGLRATASAFAAYLLSADDRTPSFRGTEFEIV